MLSKKFVVVVFALVAVLAVSAVFSVLTVTKQIVGSGQITICGVGVYQDQACTTSLTAINWGEVDPGGSVEYTAYFEDTGNSNITLSLVSSNWVPASASQILSLSWNAPLILSPSQVVAVTFTLTVDASTENLTSFSFTINITGTEL